MLIEMLREATGPLHREVETHLSVMSPGVTRDEYADALVRFYKVYRQLEPVIRQGILSGGANDALVDRLHKSEKLEADLRAMGESTATIAEIAPPVAAMPGLSQLSAIGALYVTEGATLGGQIITRHINAVLGLTTETGVSFFSGYGEENAKRWREFKEFLTTLPDRDHVEVVSGATATFRYFLSTFAEKRSTTMEMGTGSK